MRAKKIRPEIYRMRRGRGSSSSMWTPAVIKVGREKSREDIHKLRHKSEEETTLNAASGGENGKKKRRRRVHCLMS